MINSVGQGIASAISTTSLREGGKTRAAGTTSAAAASASLASASPAARMASEGAPVDMDKIAAIKAAIASGNYPVDANAIAERMIALDLPAAG